jgi:hypothetical protein
MSHRVDTAQGQKTRRIAAFLPIDFGLGANMCSPGLARPPINMVAWEKRRSLIMERCPISLPAHQMLRRRACA